jgi:hypothetical protein
MCRIVALQTGEILAGSLVGMQSGHMGLLEQLQGCPDCGA